jgi:hypothetical protein
MSRCFWSMLVPVVASVLVACAGSADLTESGAPLARQLTQSDHCGLTTPGIVMIAERSEVDTLKSLPAGHLALEPLRQVDFANEYLVLVGLGQKPTSGYGITLAGSRIRGGQLQIAVTVREPGKGVMLAQVLTTPCAVVAVSDEGWRSLKVSGEGYPVVTREHP